MENIQFVRADNLDKISIEKSLGKLYKKLFDILVSLFVIVFILSWLIPVLFILIRIESKGSVFFIQERSGLHLEKFYCIKFRSMKMNEFSDIKTTVKGDKRITKIGDFLRKSSIDELPQFFNVLMGHMTIVGPRPHMVNQTEKYNQKIYKFKERHYEKPGITGLAQISGCRGVIKNDKDMMYRLRYDLFYINNWSFLFDMKIIIKTIKQIIRYDENAV